MRRSKSQIRVVAGAMLLLAGAVAWLIIGPADTHGRLRLPVGNRNPAISLGERHGLILASDGSLWSWGSDFLGWPVLGLGTSTMKSTKLQRVSKDNNWISISAGEHHNLAIKSDGTLWTWGESVEPRFRMSTSLSFPAQAAPGNDWKQAAAGGIHSLAIKRDGTLWAWGNNWSGSVGIPSTNGSSTPVQVGSANNWIKVWASSLESVGMQSDGSLWYWGDNPDPSFAQDVGRISEPTRVSPDTNWVDVGFGVNTVFALKGDGMLWAWGRQAHVYTGAANTSRNTTPVRVGTNSDWQSIASCPGWWCLGLTKKDGSLWLMNASDGRPNGPLPPYKPVQFRPVEFPKEHAAYAAGAAHAAAAGVHAPIGVILTTDGEVWTWGLVLGDPSTLKSRMQNLASSIGRFIHLKIPPVDPDAVYREKAWQLRNIE